MKKAILSTLAIAAALSMQAGLPAAVKPTTGKAPKTQFKPAGKLQGHPSLTGLGSVYPAQQTVVGSTAIMPYRRSAYDPSAIREVRYAADQQHPVFISSKDVITAGLGSAAEAKTVALDFLDKNKPLLAIRDPKNEFSVKAYERDQIGFTHVKMSQVYMGHPVQGRELFLHFSPAGTTITGRWAATPAVGAATGLIATTTAVDNALKALTGATEKPAFSAADTKLLKYTGPTTELVLYPKDKYNDKDRWAYRVTARTNFIKMYDVMVDAQTGAVIHSIELDCTAGATTSTLTDLNGVSRTLNTYQGSNNAYYMIDISRPMFNQSSNMPDEPKGALWTIDAQNSPSNNLSYSHVATTNNNNWPSSATAASAHYNGSAAYLYYKNTHNRNSIDGNGGTIISVINVADDNGGGMDNAFWNGQLMAYGNGDQAFYPLAGGLDVAGHEMTHGVIQSTANLVYQDQAGALNESFADVFGASIDPSNWTLGEQVCKPGVFPSGSLRDLSNPHNGASQGGNGWQPATMSEFVQTTSDAGGVHTNSGITNHAYYYFATAIGRTKAEQVYYRALKNYLTTNAQFLDARIAVVQAAQDLYGSTEAQAARTAFDNVEIYDGTNTPPTSSNPVSGAEWIILQGIDHSAGAPALYMVQPATTPPPAADFHGLGTDFALNNVSVTDDGSKAWYIGTDHNIYYTNTDYTAPAAVQFTTSGDWDNVAVSRDGNRLALVSRYQDTSIYIYNISANQSVQYHLYNPTYSQDGTTTNGPIYADALDWDPTGEFVIYDERNEFNNTSGTNLSYWDIGIMRVWSNSTFGDGMISKLVNSLPDGLSIGNPVFAKNHSEIVAFDVSDGSTYDVQAANLNTGDIGTILVNNSVPNIPSYSTNDDNITFTGVDNTSTPLVGIEPVAADFINGNGNPTLLTNNGEYSVWFAKGSRANSQCAGLSVNITAQGSTDYPLSSVVLDAGSGYSSYQWNTGATSQSITVTSAGTYNVRVGTSTGCSLLSSNLTIGYPTGIHDVAAGSVSVYPVPASDRVIIDLSAATGYSTIEVTDMTGRMIATEPVTKLKQTLNISSYEDGVYIVRLRDATGSKQYTTRITKQ